MRNKFDEELDLLNEKLIVMSSLCEKLIVRVVEILIGENENKNVNITDIYKEINETANKTENLCMNLIITEQPVATDLRKVTSSLKMINDLKRISNQIMNVEEMSTYVSGTIFKNQNSMLDIANATIKMLNDSIDSFVKKDINIAKQVIEEDNIIDNLFDKIKLELITLLEKKELKSETFVDLLMIAKYFERIGDHSENIAKSVIYLVE